MWRMDFWPFSIVCIFCRLKLLDSDQGGRQNFKELKLKGWTYGQFNPIWSRGLNPPTTIKQSKIQNLWLSYFNMTKRKSNTIIKVALIFFCQALKLYLPPWVLSFLKILFHLLWWCTSHGKLPCYMIWFINL